MVTHNLVDTCILSKMSEFVYIARDCAKLYGLVRFPKNVTARIETILHTVFQVDHACFHGGEASTNSGEKLKQEEE